MIRPIVRYGAGVLHAPAAPVGEITSETRQLIDDMPPPLQESGSGCGHGGPWEAVRTAGLGAASAASFVI